MLKNRNRHAFRINEIYVSATKIRDNLILDEYTR